jgi:hypothetical protein
MSSTNKNAPEARGVQQPFNRQAGHAPQVKPGVAQLKTAVSAQSVKRPVAPPAYRPQAKPVGVQAKMAGTAQMKNHPVAPPAYRPQLVPKVLQTKQTVSQQAAQRQPEYHQVAPLVRGVGQPVRSSVQAKSASNIPTHKPAQKGQRLPQHDLTQTVQRRAAPTHNPSGSGRSAEARNVSGVVQRYPTLDDSGRKDAMIYCISTNDLTEIIYVGQTTDARAGDRFLEHVKNDGWAPWWVHKPNVYGDDESKWPYRVRTLEALKNVTKFETTAAEQWWLEKYLKEGKKLLNDATACSLDCFQKRSVDSDLYDPKNIGVASSWKPSMKAK